MVYTPVYSSLFYITGAVIPLIPYYLKLHAQYALPLSFTTATLLLATMGFIVATVTEISVKRKMLEMIVSWTRLSSINISRREISLINLRYKRRAYFP
ncbi:MAG: hypothetical protein DRN04_13740 [Thermoprotei archaeon]|nr:MAG: hypothetical protein DRN04_13740 [Thermoprotei archaeon]